MKKENEMLKWFSVLIICALSAVTIYAQAGTKAITGTITAIEGDHIQIKDETGKAVLVMLQKNTKYLKADKKPATKAELKVGTRVTISAKMDEKMKMYAAEEVTIRVADTAPPSKGAKSR
jgi:hypothetical protein